MNILLISYDYPPMKGGIANASYLLAHQLSKMGEKVIVVAQRMKKDREFDKNNNFLTYRGINIFFLRELMLLLSLPYLVIKHRIDIIDLFMWCQGGFATFITSKSLDIPYIMHAHGAEFVDYKKTLLDKIKYTLFREGYKRQIFKNADRIIAVSKYTKNIVIRSGAKKDRVDVINWGVDFNRFSPSLDKSSVISKHRLENKRILLTVSRLQDYKGHDIVINLMPELLRRIPNLVYLVVGSGKNKDFLELLVKEKKLQNCVIFTGYVDDKILPLYYNACDIFIMLTKESLDKDGVFEGFGLTFLEANSCGKPVIGARTGGIPDAIIDAKTGYLVDPDNSQEIADKIIALLENRDLAERFGEEGRRRIIEEDLSWDSIGKRIQTILKEIKSC